VSNTVEFGGWPRPPRWVWAIAAVAAAAALAGLVVARSWPNGAATSSPSKTPPPATSPVPGSAVPAACGGDAYLPLIHLARQHAGVAATVLVGGTALRQVIAGRAVSRPLPGLPDHGRQVTTLVAGPDADYALVMRCPGRGFRIYRVAAGVAHPLDTTGYFLGLLAGVHHAWAVTGATPSSRAVLTPLNGGPAVTLKTSTYPVADTAAGLVVAYNPAVNAGRPDTVELADSKTGAVLRRLAEGFAMGAAGHVVLVSLPDCGAPPTHSTCTLESITLNTGRPAATFELPAGRVPVSGAVFSPDGALAAFQLARARQDPHFMTVGDSSPPADVVVLHRQTGDLDIVPGLELHPQTQAGLAFSATGSWLLATVSEGDRGELLAWRPGLPGPALVTSLPGPLVAAPPLLPAPSWWRNG